MFKTEKIEVKPKIKKKWKVFQTPQRKCIAVNLNDIVLSVKGIYIKSTPWNRIIELNLAFWLVNEAKYLACNCELKTRLSDVVSHLRKNYRQILTQQVQKSFSTMSFLNVFKTIATFWRAKNKQKGFSKRAGVCSLFWTELQILGEA